MDFLRQPCEVASHGHDEGVEGAARCLLAELAGSEAEDVPLDGQAAHVLVATAQARARVAAVDEAVDPRDLAGSGYHGPLDRPKGAAAPGCPFFSV